ncbi:MAG TPA: CPBP family intramembrane glutamic endopeptidase [Terriglobales bacterium]|jgi:membrane protease YdiL (CAAX protease family)|nr:CPBP family intramembrane glutamic endopeptidase [Terriglobales bacterium]
MPAESKSFRAVAAPLPPLTIRVHAARISGALRRRLVWAQVIIAFLAIECGVWAARLSVRNRWAMAAGIIVVTFALVDRPSIRRLGLGLPNAMGTGLMLGVGFTFFVLLMLLSRWVGGPVPSNPLFPNMHLAWQYMVWALVQEFMLQSFFFTRCEELFGSSAAVWVTATFFAAVHVPNMVLTTFTLIGGLFFCEMFRRYRSIYLLGIVHAVLGLTLSATIPPSLLYHLRVGIGFLR